MWDTESVNAPVHYLGIELSPLQETKLLRMKESPIVPEEPLLKAVCYDRGGWMAVPNIKTWD